MFFIEIIMGAQPRGIEVSSRGSAAAAAAAVAAAVAAAAASFFCCFLLGFPSAFGVASTMLGSFDAITVNNNVNLEELLLRGNLLSLDEGFYVECGGDWLS
jgi:hypothetical protein